MSPVAPSIKIRAESPLSEDGRELIAASQKAMEEVYRPEEIFSLGPEELAKPDTRFLVARLDNRPVGCIALVERPGFGEIKRLFVDKSARGLGLGRSLVEALEAGARDRGIVVLRLETGPELAAAVRVYRDTGYMECGSFGDYADLPCSLFMEKRLA